MIKAVINSRGANYFYITPFGSLKDKVPKDERLNIEWSKMIYDDLTLNGELVHTFFNQKLGFKGSVIKHKKMVAFISSMRCNGYYVNELYVNDNTEENLQDFITICEMFKQNIRSIYNSSRNHTINNINNDVRKA